MQKFNFLPLATYVAQMVFVKTFRHQNTSTAIRLSQLLEEEVKLSSFAVVEPGKGLHVQVSSYHHSITHETLGFVKVIPSLHKENDCS